VNQVTPALFERAPTPQAMAALEVEQIRELIREIGLAPTKAKNLKRLSELLVERHGGTVPRTFDELEALPVVGHKTASVVMAQAFGVPAFPVDTHIHRLAARWGLSSGKNVDVTERDLKQTFPESSWNLLHLQIIYFGREHCPAQRHDPSVCPICSWAAPEGGATSEDPKSSKKASKKPSKSAAKSTKTASKSAKTPKTDTPKTKTPKAKEPATSKPREASAKLGKSATGRRTS
jgi:endonuclease-3